jgi:carbonic anhydrase
MALNNLPLEPGGDVQPPAQNIDVNRLLPENRRYFTFLGSLTTPPCTEDVLWLVLKQAQQLSPEQLAIFERLYAPNARPLQPAFGRIVKESR